MKTADRPRIVIDTREQTPLPIRGESIRAGLLTGDYSYVGGERHFAVERKSLNDLAASVGRDRERFENELHRLRGFDFARLLVVGTVEDIHAARYQSRIQPAAVLASLWAFEVRYRIAVVFQPTPQTAAYAVENWARWHAREIRNQALAVEVGSVGISGEGTTETLNSSAIEPDAASAPSEVLAPGRK